MEPAFSCLRLPEPLPPPVLPDAASKHATQAFFDCLRAEVAQYCIDVTVVSPSYIQTNLSLNAVTGDGSQYGGENGLCLCNSYVFAVRAKVCNPYKVWGEEERSRTHKP